jgi:hypothetical protein
MPNPLRRRLRRRWGPQALALLLAVTQVHAAEQAAVPPQAQPVPPAGAPAAPQAGAPVQPVSPLPIEQSLKVRVLIGEGGMNDLQRHVMSPLVVQVVDQEDRALEGAEVVFRFPIDGPTATFTGGKSALSVRTNGGGQAAAMNWMANGTVGTYQVHVNATYGNQVGEATVSMTNVTRIEADAQAKQAKGKSLWSHTWFKAAVIGGAVAIGVGIYFATRGGGKSGSTVTVTPGAPSVGTPP